MSKRIVIALGGNALGKTAQEQLQLVTETARPIVDLIEAGNEVVVVVSAMWGRYAAVDDSVYSRPLRPRRGRPPPGRGGRLGRRGDTGRRGGVTVIPGWGTDRAVRRPPSSPQP